jgi:hypothetical protein
LDEVGLAAMPIDVTEIGWPTQGVGKFGAPPIPDDTRAANITLTADALVGSDCGVRSFIPYTWVSAEKDEDYDEDWMGILNRDLTPSEASAAYGADVERQSSKAVAAVAGAAPSRPLRVCEVADPDDGAAPLRMGLELGTRADGARRCYDARRGRQLDAREDRRRWQGDLVHHVAGRRPAPDRRGVGGDPPRRRGDAGGEGVALSEAWRRFRGNVFARRTSSARQGPVTRSPCSHPRGPADLAARR